MQLEDQRRAKKEVQSILFGCQKKRKDPNGGEATEKGKRMKGEKKRNTQRR